MLDLKLGITKGKEATYIHRWSRGGRQPTGGSLGRPKADEEEVGHKRKRSKELRADWIHVGDGEAEGRTGAMGWKWGWM